MKRDFSRKPTCSDPVLGELLPNYEAGSLDPQKVVQFEEHLLYCDYCYYELEGLQEIRRKLGRHRVDLQRHYAKSGSDFKAELAHLADAQNRDKPRGISTAVRDSIGRITNSQARWFVYPGLAVALLALIVVLKNFGPPPLDHRMTDSHNSSPEQPSTSIIVADSSANLLNQDSSLAADDPTNTPETGQQRSIEWLLPKQAIPYAMLAVRGEESRDSLLSAEFQECMLPYQKGNFARSASLLSQFVATHPSDPQAQLYLGSALYMTRDFEGAIVALSAVERLGGEQIDPKVPYYRAAALIALQRTAEAKSILVKLRTSPNRIIAQQSRMLLSELESR